MAVSDKTRVALWTRAAGRCQYRGCNKHLLGEAISGNRLLNQSYIAHIVAEKPGGPRGDEVRSPLLADAIENLMLLCDAHHRLIDRDGQAEHIEPVLLSMKADHEVRIEMATSIAHDKATHVLLYGARVGRHDAPARFDLAKLALLPKRWPAEERAIQLDMSGVDLDDHEPDYWPLQQSNLRRQFRNRVLERLQSGEIKHLSVFAIAPQPLLIELGRLLGDIAQVGIHQLHREPQGWDWREQTTPLALIIREPVLQGTDVALKLALSATVTDERIQATLGSGTPIWSVETPDPNRDSVRSQSDLAHVREVFRTVLDRIKAKHGEGARIHVFPALPVSAAVEMGRVWMPKADLPMVIYDQDQKGGGFIQRLTISDGTKEQSVAEKGLVNG